MVGSTNIQRTVRGHKTNVIGNNKSETGRIKVERINTDYRGENAAQ